MGADVEYKSYEEREDAAGHEPQTSISYSFFKFNLASVTLDIV